jgi:hypothetical protein
MYRSSVRDLPRRVRAWQFIPGRRQLRPADSRAPGVSRRFQPHLEWLEDRILPTTTFTVMNLNDSGMGSLRAAVSAANMTSGSEAIVFNHGLHGTITLTSGPLEVSNTAALVAIQGLGANHLAVSGNNASRIFQLDPGTNLTISGLTLTGGLADVGGAILNNGGNLGLSSDVFFDNESIGGSDPFDSAYNNSGARGGAVASGNGATLSVTGCAFVANLADGTAGDDSARGGALYSVGLHTSAMVSNCTFLGNQGIATNGAIGGAGAIYHYVRSSTTVTGSFFVGNQGVGGNNGSGGGQEQGAGNAGAILNSGSVIVIGTILGATLEVNGSTFIGNQALGGNNGIGSTYGGAEGGAIRSLFATLNVTGCAFVANEARGGSGNQGQTAAAMFIGSGTGGALETDDGTATVTNRQWHVGDPPGIFPDHDRELRLHR